MKATTIMAKASSVKSRFERRMLRGRLEKQLLKARLSIDLVDSALAEYDRIAPIPSSLPEK